MGYRYFYGCIVLLLLGVIAYILWICWPLSAQGQEGIQRQRATYSFSLSLDSIDIIIHGSGSHNYHGQRWQIYDSSYDLQRTGYISFYNSGYDVYTRITRREKDTKIGDVYHQAIDTIADYARNEIIHLLSGNLISGYMYTDNRPWTEFQRSSDAISLKIHSYCHTHRWKRKEYVCSVSGRISFPRGYRPLEGTIHLSHEKVGENISPQNLLHALSVPELLQRVR